MLTTPSKEYSRISGRKAEALKDFNVSEYKSLRKLGISMDESTVKNLMRGSVHIKSLAMDAIQPTITTASVSTPLQFLQEWLPGFVRTVTGVRVIDELVGLNIVGEWSDEQVIQGILEPTGSVSLYGDYTEVPYGSWNTNFNARTVVRFEEGMRVGRLEADRTARQQVDDAGEKRANAALQLEIQRNYVGFYGFNSGANNTYGFLNDPGLPSYVQVPTGASSSRTWANKTAQEIINDIRTSLGALQTNSQGLIDPERVAITLAIATNSVIYLSKITDLGISVRDWLRVTYPSVRVVSAPQLNIANASSNVFYAYADRIDDGSTDGGAVWGQFVQTKFMVLGVQQLVKAYEESYSNGTAGVMAKRPWAIVRYYGI